MRVEHIVRDFKIANVSNKRRKGENEMKRNSIPEFIRSENYSFHGEFGRNTILFSLAEINKRGDFPRTLIKISQ